MRIDAHDLIAQENRDSAEITTTLADLGQAANAAAKSHAFHTYTMERSQNSLRAQRNDLQRLANFLHSIQSNRPIPLTLKFDGDTLQNSPAAWKGFTYGLLEAFKLWLLQEGFALRTINRTLSTVRTYTKLAGRGDFIDSAEIQKIQTVHGIPYKNGATVDAKRDISRIGDKKAEHVPISHEVAKRLKRDHLNTPMGKRDKLLMCLLLNHGLRASEVEQLKVANFSVEEDGKLLMRFFRPKTKGYGQHVLTPETQSAYAAYVEVLSKDKLNGSLLFSAKKSGDLRTKQMKVRDITRRVNLLGEQAGTSCLSAHDCRHYLATKLARRSYGIDQLMQFFGWTSPTTAMRYVEQTQIDNQSIYSE